MLVLPVEISIHAKRKEQHMTYEYKSPLDRGMQKVKVPKERHNAVFSYRKRTLFKSFFFRYHYYADDRSILIELLPTLFTKILNTVFVPVVILVYGIANYREILTEVKRSWCPRKYGAFTADEATGESYKVLMGL